MNTPHVPALLICLSLAALSACDKDTDAPAESVLASIDGYKITEKDYEEYLKARQLQRGPMENKDEERKAALDEMISRILLARHAQAIKLDQEPEIRTQLERQRENILARAMLRKYLKEHPVTDEDVDARYRQEMEKTHKTEYKARHILVKTEEEARAILAQLQRGANFAALAKNRSIDPRSGKDGGNLGWFNEGQMDPDFFQAVAKIKKGEIGKEPVKSEFGWHVIKVENTRPWRTPPRETVETGIRELLQQERIDTLVKDLRDKAKVEIH